MTLPRIIYGDWMECDPKGLYHADERRRLWGSALPKMWYTPEDIDKSRVIPIRRTAKD